MFRKLCVVALLALPVSSSAQWSSQPNGELAYTFAYQTAGVFSCFGANFLQGTCNANGNAITFGNSGATATLTFLGAGGNVVATNVTTAGMVLGGIVVTFGGVGPFTWPTQPTAGGHLFDLSIVVSETGPAPGAANYTTGYLRQNATLVNNQCCEGNPGYFKLPITPPPGGRTYSSVVVDHITRPEILIGGATTYAISGAFGLVPEPGTWALMAVGLAFVGVVRRRA